MQQFLSSADQPQEMPTLCSEEGLGVAFQSFPFFVSSGFVIPSGTCRFLQFRNNFVNRLEEIVMLSSESHRI